MLTHRSYLIGTHGIGLNLSSLLEDRHSRLQVWRKLGSNRKRYVSEASQNLDLDCPAHDLALQTLKQERDKRRGILDRFFLQGARNVADGPDADRAQRCVFMVLECGDNDREECI